MLFLVNHNGFHFYGKFQDLLTILSAYGPETTLQEFIKLNLN